MALTNFRPRGDVKANWEAANPIIKEREMCIEWEEAIGVGQPRIKFGKSGSTTHYMDLDYAVLPIKHDTKDGWSSANPVLEKGEMGVEWETAIGEGAVCIKFGDDTTAWNDLEYASTDRLKEIIEPSSDNEALAVGDTLPVIAGKLNNQQEFLKTKLGYDRLDALAAKLSGLSNRDFTGIMEFLSDRKFDKANVYNGLDSTNANLALSAAAGKSLSTKLGTGKLPTGMNNVVDGLTRLNSNFNAGNTTNSSSGDKPITSSVDNYTDIKSVDIPPGVYVIIARIEFQSTSATGDRKGRLAFSSSSGTYELATECVRAASSNWVRLSVCDIFKTNVSGSIKVQGSQSSGSTINTFGCVSYVLLKAL